tara:strand:+ start:318 stop:503 length:186 start_codon:yes stop_codon:yes gene_type:complete
MKNLELNQMENLQGGGFWESMAVTTLCSAVGILAGAASMGAGFAAGLVCNAMFYGATTGEE